MQLAFKQKKGKVLLLDFYSYNTVIILHVSLFYSHILSLKYLVVAAL